MLHRFTEAGQWLSLALISPLWGAGLFCLFVVQGYCIQYGSRVQMIEGIIGVTGEYSAAN